MKSTLSIILISIIALALGGVLGYQLDRNLPLKVNLSFLLSSEELGLLDNVVVELRGLVEEIDDRRLVLRPAEGVKSLEIIIDPEMRIFVGQLTMAGPVGEIGDGNVIQMPITDIKAGDQVMAHCVLTADVCKLNALVVQSDAVIEE